MLEALIAIILLLVFGSFAFGAFRAACGERNERYHIPEDDRKVIRFRQRRAS